VHAWLTQGAPGRLPGDARVALSELQDSDNYSDAAYWTRGEDAEGPDGRTHLSFGLLDPLYFRGLTVCVDERSQWCGVVVNFAY
jgi:hypothetical protein